MNNLRLAPTAQFVATASGQMNLSREEMIEIRKTIEAMQDEIHHPGAWQHNDGRDPAELDSDVIDALQRLTHAIGPESEG